MASSETDGSDASPTTSTTEVNVMAGSGSEASKASPEESSTVTTSEAATSEAVTSQATTRTSPEASSTQSESSKMDSAEKLNKDQVSRVLAGLGSRSRIEKKMASSGSL